MPRSAPNTTIRLNSATHSEPKFLSKGVKVPTQLSNFEVYYCDGSFYFLELGKTTEYKNLCDWGAGTWMAFPMVYSVKVGEDQTGWLTVGDGDHWTRQPVGKNKVRSFAEAQDLMLKHFKGYTPIADSQRNRC